MLNRSTLATRRGTSLHHGTLLLQTFVDVEPVFVGFLAVGQGLCMVDRSGEVHVWELEGGDELPDDSERRTPTAETPRSSALVQQCLGGAAYLNRVQDLIARGERDGARLLLDALPHVPDAQIVQRYWLDRLADDPIPPSAAGSTLET